MAPRAARSGPRRGRLTRSASIALENGGSASGSRSPRRGRHRGGDPHRRSEPQTELGRCAPGIPASSGVLSRWGATSHSNTPGAVSYGERGPTGIKCHRLDGYADWPTSWRVSPGLLFHDVRSLPSVNRRRAARSRVNAEARGCPKPHPFSAIRLAGRQLPGNHSSLPIGGGQGARAENQARRNPGSESRLRHVPDVRPTSPLVGVGREPASGSVQADHPDRVPARIRVSTKCPLLMSHTA